MDITTTLNQIIALDIQDRIRLVQSILGVAECKYDKRSVRWLKT